ncbi:fimbria/pilus outer membrane usher protein [Amylibacter sp.]|nr:fimbria/pilus outer membrane usher protein [Amylibacter sp.]MDB9727306.1 fimbria/pilus outer membrane usher protein [Amylibacter sp.]MDB9816460.1 fimbria/pilus outer membrane usher protein [Amylibacter sp.]MDC1445897.1 fimbria/pilus outer membrane usher protein [Amylibacter sp.]
MLNPSTSLAEGTSFDIEEVFLNVFINDQHKDTVLLLRNEGRLFAVAQDLRRWRLHLPNTNPLTFYGEDFYALDALRGLTFKLDESTQSLAMQVPPRLFETTLLNGQEIDFSAPSAASPGGFINYSLLANHAEGLTNSTGSLDLSGFGSWGSAQTRILGLDLNNEARAIRLESTWTRDKPMELTRLRFGDAISGASSWGGAVRFGGVQWATDFSLQPGFMASPRPEISGESSLPSTVELYVDNLLRMRREVPSGPFTIQDLPVINGQGDAQLVVRDILGREQVITQPFFTSSRLLKQGLQSYSYELGFVRRDFGIDSNNYGRLMAVGTHRLGFTEKFTGEVHGELLGNQQSVGLAGVFLSPLMGILSGSLAMSNSKKGVGGLLGFGFQHQSGNFSVGVNTQLTSRNFAKLGMQSEKLAPQHISQMVVKMATNDFGSFAVNYTQQALRDLEEQKSVSASYVSEVAGIGNLSASLTRYLSGEAKTVFGLNFSMNLDLGKRRNANINVSAKPGRNNANLQLNRKSPAGGGVGYRLVSGLGDTDRREAEVSLQNGVGNYSLAAGQSQGQTAFRGSATGGVAFLGGSSFFSRRITDSFALVQVPGYADVGIYADNRLSTRTDSKGNALLTGLRSYQKNPVRIEQSDIPLDAQIDTLQLDAVPYFRSGLVLKFPVKRSRGALLSVVLENGEPLPAGAQVVIIDKNILENELFPTGMGGEVYLTGLEAENQLRVIWREQICEFALTFPETTEPLPHLGTYICVGVEP